MGGYSIVDFGKYGEFEMTLKDETTLFVSRGITNVLTDEDKANLFDVGKPCYVKNATGSFMGRTTKVSGWTSSVEDGSNTITAEFVTANVKLVFIKDIMYESYVVQLTANIGEMV